MILRGKPLQCEGEKPRAPASNTSRYFQEFGLQHRMAAYKRMNHSENPNRSGPAFGFTGPPLRFVRSLPKSWATEFGTYPTHLTFQFYMLTFVVLL